VQNLTIPGSFVCWDFT